MRIYIQITDLSVGREGARRPDKRHRAYVLLNGRRPSALSGLQKTKPRIHIRGSLAVAKITLRSQREAFRQRSFRSGTLSGDARNDPGQLLQRRLIVFVSERG